LNQQKIIFILIGTIALMLGFQNCSPPPKAYSPFVNTNVNQSVALGFVEMTEAEARALIVGYEGQCAAGSAAMTVYPLLPINASLTPSNPSLSRAISGTYKATAVQRISGDGTVVIFNSELASNPYINELSDFNGNIHICGLGLGLVASSVVGNIVIENGSIMTANEATGNIFIINGEFPNSSFGFKGQIVIKNPNGIYQGRTYF